MLVAKFFGLYVEGYLGIIIGLFIIKSGIEVLMESFLESLLFCADTMLVKRMLIINAILNLTNIVFIFCFLGRENALVKTADKYILKFQTFGRMNGHEFNAVLRIFKVGIRVKCYMF